MPNRQKQQTQLHLVYLRLFLINNGRKKNLHCSGFPRTKMVPQCGHAAAVRSDFWRGGGTVMYYLSSGLHIKMISPYLNDVLLHSASCLTIRLDEDYHPVPPAFFVCWKWLCADNIYFGSINRTAVMKYIEIMTWRVVAKLTDTLQNRFEFVFDGWNSADAHHISIYDSIPAEKGTDIASRCCHYGLWMKKTALIWRPVRN